MLLNVVHGSITLHTHTVCNADTLLQNIGSTLAFSEDIHFFGLQTTYGKGESWGSCDIPVLGYSQ